MSLKDDVNYFLNYLLPKVPIFYEYLLRKSTLKLRKILQICVRSFVNSHPVSLFIQRTQFFLKSRSMHCNRCQFHQHFSFKRHFGSFFYVHVTREKLTKLLLNKKFVRKMVMELTTGQLKHEMLYLKPD